MQRYSREWPDRCATVSACRDALRRADHQFPEAACPIATRLLCEVMDRCVPVCGTFKSAAMREGRNHMWCFDARAGVHIDLTHGQFPGTTKRIAIHWPCDGPFDGYTLSPLEKFNEAMGLSYMKDRMEDIMVGGTTLARIAEYVKRHCFRLLKRVVELDVALFRSCASRVMKPRIAWHEYTAFMRRCGFEAYRDDKHGPPRVCVAPFDSAPLVRDCLGMTEPGNEKDVARLCSAHIRHVARLISSSLRDRSFEVSDAFWRRNVACDGFFVLSKRTKPAGRRINAR